MVQSLTELERERARRKRNVEVMRNLTEMLKALDTICAGMYPAEQGWVDRALTLRIKLARELLICCEELWKDPTPENTASVIK